MINLFYLSKNTTGGWVTFTSHLSRSLTAMNVEHRIYKIGNNTELCTRPFGYGLSYKNVTLAHALQMGESSRNVIVACAKQLATEAKALLAAGARIVIHDPTEVKSYLNPSDVKRPWVIRKVNATMVNGVFIRHPYVRMSAGHPVPAKRKGCVSISRIDFDKHTEMLLDANRLGAGIRIHGFENRLYTRFKIMPNYPEWEQSVAAYPREHDAAFRLLLSANSMADMSLIKGDGGGTQYTTLEAWDAGTVPIVQSAWLRPKDDLVFGKNVLAANDAENLKTLVKQMDKDVDRREALRAGGYSALLRHAPKKIVPQVMDWLENAK